MTGLQMRSEGFHGSALLSIRSWFILILHNVVATNTCERELTAFPDNVLKERIKAYGKTCDDCEHTELIAKLCYLLKHKHKRQDATPNGLDTLVTTSELKPEEIHREQFGQLSDEELRQRLIEEGRSCEDCTKEELLTKIIHLQPKPASRPVFFRSWIKRASKLVSEAGEHLNDISCHASRQDADRIEGLSDTELREVLGEYGRSCEGCDHAELVQKAMYLKVARDGQCSAFLSTPLRTFGGMLAEVADVVQAATAAGNDSKLMLNQTTHAMLQGVQDILQHPDLFVSSSAAMMLQVLQYFGVAGEHYVLVDVITKMAKQHHARELCRKMRNWLVFVFIVFTSGWFGTLAVLAFGSIACFDLGTVLAAVDLVARDHVICMILVFRLVMMCSSLIKACPLLRTAAAAFGMDCARHLHEKELSSRPLATGINQTLGHHCVQPGIKQDTLDTIRPGSRAEGGEHGRDTIVEESQDRNRRKNIEEIHKETGNDGAAVINESHTSVPDRALIELLKVVPTDMLEAEIRRRSLTLQISK